MVFVKKKNDCGMAAKWILGNKKGRRKKRRPKQNGAKKTLGIYKRNKTQNLADERRIMGRFAKRFSGERPVSLGFELTFLSEFKRVVWRVLV